MKLIYRFAMLKIMLEQSCDEAKTPKARTSRKARLHQFPVVGLFRPVIADKPSRRDKAPGALISYFHPGAYGEVTGARLCRVSCFFPVIYRRRAAGRAIPVRAGTGRPHRRSRRVRSHRSPPPCGRRGRACDRRAPPGDCWASPSPRRGEARARSSIRRDAG